MSQFTQGNEYYSKIKESGGNSAIASLAEDKVLPMGYQVIRGKIVPRAAGSSFQLLDHDGVPVRVYEGQRILQLSGNGVGIVGTDASQIGFGLVVDATGAKGATGAVAGTTVPISISILGPQFTGTSTLLNISGPIKIDSTLANSTIVGAVSGVSISAGYLDVIATIL